ncbi:cobyric acid synthase [Aureimonas flava]|uniref:Cobyric acid synthase n=1 Tax=Aureimonas flava TaxID=2320271 RepID=A0A3A1WP54_9HYPH|nr:cobyric acid synthase [Aureimonas flava]RIX99081.1 cobyric acid synthase [Aureimonas flava]
MLQGTGSDVGKSVLVAGLCRLFVDRGLRVRPFKPQNMSNNAAVAWNGDRGEWGEIGRAQALQALACRTAPSVHMNPVLLKPQSETGSQVVVWGEVRGTAAGRDYQRLKATLLPAVLDSFARVGEDADLVVVEGAGSPAEINLRAGDIANMGFARAAGVPVVLVGDIDRGGVIASLVGTHAILPPEDRAQVAGFLVNKFRGDPALFGEGMAAVTRFTGWPGFGLVPWLPETARLPAEDSVALDRRPPADSRRGDLLIAVPRLPHIANFDDLDPLAATPGVSLALVRPGEPWPDGAGLVLLPGSKATIADLGALRREGWDRAILAHRSRGGHVLGLCGGYQMLGRRILDPDGIEGEAREAEGLGLLDVDTRIAGPKTLREVEARAGDGTPFPAYEIHMGRSEGPDRDRPFAHVGAEREGASSADGRVRGTYLHGLFAGDRWREAYLGGLGVAPAGRSHRAEVERALDAIAARLEACLDIAALERIARAR